MFSLEAGTGILLGQSDGLMLLAASLAILALDRAPARDRRPAPGPLLLKPQLVWLVPPILVIARQWRMLVALVAGARWSLLGSIAVAGPGHLLDAIGLVTARLCAPGSPEQLDPRARRRGRWRATPQLGSHRWCLR